MTIGSESVDIILQPFVISILPKNIEYKVPEGKLVIDSNFSKLLYK